MTSEEVGKLVEDAAKALGEHFEAVQILASNSDGKGTSLTLRGTGNFYARLQMAREFIINDKNETLGHKIADAMRDDEE